jgi:hypothetical protein
VAKVDELMALCDELEAQLKASQERGARLLEACVRQMGWGEVVSRENTEDAVAAGERL